MKLSHYSLVFAIASFPYPVFAAEYEIQRLNQGQLFIYDDEVKTALLVNSMSEPQCYQIGDIIILLSDSSQASDLELLQKTARAGFANYLAYCADKSQQGSKVRNVVALVVDGSIPNDFNIATHSNILMFGRITTTGLPSDGVLEILSNKTIITKNKNSAGAKIQNKFNEEHKLKLANKKMEVDTIRARFALKYEQSRISSKPTSFLGGIFSSDSTKLSGAWSTSKSQCDHDVLILKDNDGFNIIEWWRDTRNYGLLPWRSGSWNLKNDFLTMTFNHRVEFTFMNGFEDTLMDETVQLVLKSISSDELHLASSEPNSKAVKLLNADEKLFIRCQFN